MEPSTAAIVLTVMSAAASAKQQRQQARDLQVAAAADQQRKLAAAKQAEAAGQAAANAERRKAELAASRALAVAAASGAGGQGVENIITDILVRGERNAGSALYESIERGAGLRDAAAVGSWQAGLEASSLRRAATNTLLEGAARATSMYAKYKGDGPPKTSPSADADSADADAGYSLPRRYWEWGE